MDSPTVVIGGTFDTIHTGHEQFLTSAYSVGGTVLIGLTSDDYVRMYKPSVVNPYDERKKQLMRWLTERGYAERTMIVPITDQYGPATTDKVLTTIVVSTETAPTAAAINRLRQTAGLRPLSIIEVPIVYAHDQKPISTTRVRRGEIDREGNLVLPEPMREELSQPFGEIFSEDRVTDIIESDAEGKRIIIAVGDFTVKRVLDSHIVPSLSVIDLKIGRVPFQPFAAYGFPTEADIRHIQSGPGFIAPSAVDAVKAWAQNPKLTVIVVDGEEDLLALPIFLHAPDGSVVYYGQPGKGMVRVLVDDTLRKSAEELLSRFTRS